MTEDKITFSATLENEVATKFQKLKKYYGLENNTEVIRILIFEKHKQLFTKEV